MGLAQPFLEFENWLGINNVEDPARLRSTKAGAWMRYGENIDIDDTRKVWMRLGFGVPVVAGTIDAAWSNGKIALYLDAGNLKRLFEDGTTQTLVSGLGLTPPFACASHNDTVFFSTLRIFGMIENGAAMPIPAPNQTFKKKMVGGHLLEVFNNRLYAAQESRMFYSDAMALTRMDGRKNFMQFPNRLRMIRALSTGIYICEGDNIHWLMGDDPFGFVDTVVTDEGMIPGSDIVVDGMEVGPGMLGKVAFWLSESGPFMGLPDGQVKNVAKGIYNTLPFDKGAALYRSDRGFSQYVFVGELNESEGPEFDLSLPRAVVSFTGNPNFS